MYIDELDYLNREAESDFPEQDENGEIMENIITFKSRTYNLTTEHLTNLISLNGQVFDTYDKSLTAFAKKHGPATAYDTPKAKELRIVHEAVVTEINNRGYTWKMCDGCFTFEWVKDGKCKYCK